MVHRDICGTFSFRMMNSSPIRFPFLRLKAAIAEAVVNEEVRKEVPR
jgi:hypothetical protein